MIEKCIKFELEAVRNPAVIWESYRKRKGLGSNLGVQHMNGGAAALSHSDVGPQ